MKKISPRKNIMNALNALAVADKALESIRDQYNLEWGVDANCDLDLVLSHVIHNIGESTAKLNELRRLPRITLNYRRNRRKAS